MSRARSKALVGGAAAGAHVPPTQVHWPHHDDTLRCLMTQAYLILLAPTQPRTPIVGNRFDPLAATELAAGASARSAQKVGQEEGNRLLTQA